jgi:tetraacyldisaccharide 4'-kinase
MNRALHDWLQRVWYGSQGAGLLLLPFSWLFGAVVRLRHALYRAGLLRAIDVGCPVVVVGNVTAGGTGKTPLTLWLALQLRSAGRRPGIVMRGYGGTGRIPRLVQADALASEVGDEALLLARRCGCPLAVGADRVAAARLLVAGGVDIVVADDGLQHLRLKREVEIVVIDGERRFGNRRLLPAGPLREPLRRLAEVDALVVNGEPVTEQEISMRLVATDAVTVTGGARRALSHFAPGPVHALAAIGNPARFFSMLDSHGIRVIPHAFPDHHRFERGDIEFGDSLPVLMTEKDAVKCESFADQRHWFVPVDADFDAAGGRLLRGLVRRSAGPG